MSKLGICLLHSGTILILLCISACSKSNQLSPEQRAQELAEQKALKQHKAELEQNAWQNLPSAPYTLEAIQFLRELKNAGQLPDLEDARHSLEFPKGPFSTNYPMSRTFVVRMQSSSFVNRYTLIKTSADTQWHLQKAWRTDEKGVITKVYLDASDQDSTSASKAK